MCHLKIEENNSGDEVLCQKNNSSPFKIHTMEDLIKYAWITNNKDVPGCIKEL